MPCGSGFALSSPELVVYGGTGLVGRRVCRELAAYGMPFSIAGRRPANVDGVQAVVATIDDAAALVRAFEGSRVVINAAGPLRDTAAPVLVAALAAGAHYVDVGGEQAVLRSLYERHESTARRAGLVAMPGAGVDCVIGDLAAAWAAAHLGGDREEQVEVIRTAPADRRSEDRPLDEIATSYVFDGLELSAGSQRALFAQLAEKTLVWRRARWEAGAAGAHRRITAGTKLGGERDAFAYPGGEVITVPRHVAAARVATYVSTTRHAATSTALRLLARALPFAPAAARALLAPYAAADTDYAQTQFAIVAQVRRGFSAAQLVVRGHDLYQTTAVITAWAARALVARPAGPVGMRAPAELFFAEPALRAIATAASLTIEPSFG